MANGPRLNIDIAEKRFAVLPEPLFRDFHLTVEAATVLAIVGPSGVGKSSLLRMVAGIDNDYDGDIRVDGVAAADAPPPGFVFQDSRLLPWLTALGNIRAARRQTTEAEARELLAQVGLKGYEDAYPHELSGGMQRRVAIARAFSVNTSLLLLDEPFVSLDRQLAEEVQRVFLDLVRNHRPTVLLVTHLPDDAARLADRAITLSGMPVGVVADVNFSSRRDERSATDLERLAREISPPNNEAQL